MDITEIPLTDEQGYVGFEVVTGHLIQDDIELTVFRNESHIQEAQSPDIYIAIDNEAALFDQTVIVRACGCEFHFDPASFMFFACDQHREIR